MLLDLRPAVPLVPHPDADTDHAAWPLLLQVQLGGEAGVGLGADAVRRRQHKPCEQSQDRRGYDFLKPFIDQSPSTIKAFDCPLTTLSLYDQESQPGPRSKRNR